MNFNLQRALCTAESSQFAPNRDVVFMRSSSIITKEVVDAYAAVGGDFQDCVPYCLLEARRSFKRDANSDQSDCSFCSSSTVILGAEIVVV